MVGVHFFLYGPSVRHRGAIDLREHVTDLNTSLVSRPAFHDLTNIYAVQRRKFQLLHQIFQGTVLLVLRQILVQGSHQALAYFAHRDAQHRPLHGAEVDQVPDHFLYDVRRNRE